MINDPKKASDNVDQPEQMDRVEIVSAMPGDPVIDPNMEGTLLDEVDDLEAVIASADATFTPGIKRVLKRNRSRKYHGKR